VHDDGEISRWVQGFVKMESGVPSHMKFDHSAGLLYIADTGNNRIAVLNPSSGARSSNYGPDYDGITRSGGGMYYMQAQLTTFLDGQAAGLSQPSGLALHDNKVFVSDYDSGRIYAFDMEGVMIDYLDPGRGRGSVVGMAFDSAGNLFVADLNNEQILKISPKQ
jgi:DNA-binding beta-propeller fold protein YncE